MTRARSIALGVLLGFLAAIVAIVCELLGWFNCISVWLVETMVITLFLAIAMRRFRTITIGSIVLAYITIISYIVIHAQRTGRWFADDWTPVVASFFLLVALPTLFARALDLISFRHARHDA